MKYELTVILPSINPDKWVQLYAMIENSVKPYSFEVIAVGPNFPPKDLESKLNFRYIREFSSPSRSLMVGANLANGKYITWIPDDSIVIAEALKECVEFLNTKTKDDALVIRYTEGPNFTGNQSEDPNYWIARTHKDLQLKWVRDGWKVASIFMYNLEKFKELGGLDCSFYHINMQCHSLAFKLQLQNNGGMHFSPRKVLSCNWAPWVGHHGEIMRIAYETNDAPKFKEMWDGPEEPKLDWTFDNWQKAAPYWELRYK